MTPLQEIKTNRFSNDAHNFGSKTLKPDAVRVAAELNRRGIRCILEYAMLRHGEFNSQGQPK